MSGIVVVDSFTRLPAGVKRCNESELANPGRIDPYVAWTAGYGLVCIGRTFFNSWRKLAEDVQ